MSYTAKANSHGGQELIAFRIGDQEFSMNILPVDAVSGILTVWDQDIQPTPEIANDHEKSFARGILPIDKRMICLVELDALFPESESEAA